jgi:hypothetical protein
MKTHLEHKFLSEIKKHFQKNCKLEKVIMENNTYTIVLNI